MTCEDVEVRGQADCVHIEAPGDGHAGGGSDPPTGKFRAHILTLEKGLWRAGHGRAAAR
jgi:hypothetical protein